MTGPSQYGDVTEFAATLQAEQAAFQQFYELLQAEKDALSRNEVDRLPELAQLKSEKILQLSQLAEQRNLYLAAHSCLPDQAGMEEWYRRSRGETGIRLYKIWQDMLKQARAAHQLNQENGALIELKLQHNQQALAIIRAAANQNGVYGRDGLTQASHSGRPIDKV